MPHAGDNVYEGYALRATPPATRLSYASALLLSEAPAVYLKNTDFHKTLHNLTQINTAALCKSACISSILVITLCLLKPLHLLNKSIC